MAVALHVSPLGRRFQKRGAKKTDLLPRRRPPAALVLDEDVARADLLRPDAASASPTRRHRRLRGRRCLGGAGEVGGSTGEGGDLLGRQAGGDLPDGCPGRGRVEVGERLGLGVSDFPAEEWQPGGCARRVEGSRGRVARERPRREGVGARSRRKGDKATMRIKESSLSAGRARRRAGRPGQRPGRHMTAEGGRALTSQRPERRARISCRVPVCREGRQTMMRERVGVGGASAIEWRGGRRRSAGAIASSQCFINDRATAFLKEVRCG